MHTQRQKSVSGFSQNVNKALDARRHNNQLPPTPSVNQSKEAKKATPRTFKGESSPKESGYSMQGYGTRSVMAAGATKKRIGVNNDQPLKPGSSMGFETSPKG